MQVTCSRQHHVIPPSTTTLPAVPITVWADPFYPFVIHAAFSISASQIWPFSGPVQVTVLHSLVGSLFTFTGLYLNQVFYAVCFVCCLPLCCLLIHPWGWKYHIPQKCRWTTRLYDGTSQKIVLCTRKTEEYKALATITSLYPNWKNVYIKAYLSYITYARTIGCIKITSFTEIDWKAAVDL
jgi:hypothetical protein